MKIIRTIPLLRKALGLARSRGKSVGFVPTMGALHEGHLSLIRRSKKENSLTVVSIFVNPTQFGPKEDYRSYPRTLRRDAQLAQRAGADLIFYPSVHTMYPNDHAAYVNVESTLYDTLCGRSRPGHFRGVATVVSKLLNIIQSTRMYLGQKDAQQCVILKRMVRDLHIPTTVIICPTVRERDGLAMSSRNKYLNARQRREAIVLYQALQLAQAQVKKGKRKMSAVLRDVRHYIQAHSSGEVDYVACVDPVTLQPVSTLKGKALLAVAVRFEHARLIDNVFVSTYNA